MCGDSKRKQHRTFFPLNNKGHAAVGSANSAAGTLGDSQMRQWPTVTETSWRKVAAVKKDSNTDGFLLQGSPDRSGQGSSRLHKQ